MASAKPRYVDVQNPALAIECPRCGLLTARFNQYCRNCGYSLWPSSRMASAAFQAWRAQEPDRAEARRFDVALPVDERPPLFDFEARAHELGIHIFPSSNYPVVIAAGIMVMAFAAVPFAGEPAWLHAAIGVAGAIVFLLGVGGWVLVEDQRMYPSDGLEVEHAGHGHGDSTHVVEEV